MTGCVRCRSPSSQLLPARRLGRFGIDCKRANAGITIGLDRSDIAILTINAANVCKLGRGGTPYDRRGPLLRRFHVARGIYARAAIGAHRIKRQQLFLTQMSRQRPQHGTGMDGMAAHMRRTATIECRGKQRASGFAWP